VNLSFDLENITITEFGVGRDGGDGETFVLVPVDADVQAALLDMVNATGDALDELGDPSEYEPSEKYDAHEYILLPLQNDLASHFQLLHTADNLALSAEALAEPSEIFCYFVRMSDSSGRRLTAIRRSTQFKGVLKSRLIRLVTDAMKLVTESVFKLDRDFDLLVDQDTVHVLRPKALETIGKLQAAVLAAVPENVSVMQEQLPYVDFDSIRDYAIGHSRAARNLAALRSSGRAMNIDKAALIKMCAKTGVQLLEADGKITVEAAYIVGFLEVLDRRRYEVELVIDSPEPFRASSRQRI
jgi:hypothetical protein